MGKYFEKFFSEGLSIIFFIIVCFININSIVNMKDIILSIITFVSILIGFLTTMLSILITAMDNSIMQYLRKNKKIKDLYRYITIPIVLGFILIIICLMFIPICDVGNYKSYPNYYLLGLFFPYFALSCVRAIGVLLLLLFKFIDESDEENVEEDDELDLSNAFNEDDEQ